MNSQQGEPTVLKVFVPKGHSPAYPWIGLLVGAGLAVLLAYPLVLMINLLYDHFTFGVPLHLGKAILRGLKPQLWPLILLYALGGGLAGVILGRIFQRIQENRLRLNNLHHEFELQVTALRHHYKNLALGIQGFSNRIKRKMVSLEEHFQACARTECLTYGQFYQDFDSLQQSVAILEETSQRLTHTLGQELLFLRALTSKSPAMEPRDFYPFLEHCVRDLQGLRFREKHIRVEINGLPLGESRESLTLAFDPHIMEVVLQNILTNAMKSGDHLHIRVKEDNDLVRVEVADNGPGMDIPEVQRQLMVASRGRDVESTYLGLKVSLHLLEKCQGRLLAQSRPGNGATFIVELPKHHHHPQTAPLCQAKGDTRSPGGNKE
jgi:signal transduction histidine kinase